MKPPQDLSPSLSNLIRTRRSIRRYTDQPVPHTLLASMLETAMWSPSAHNRQPWRFAVLTDSAEKATLATAMGARLRTDRTRDGDPADAIERDVARSFARLTGAPVLIVVSVSLVDMDVYSDERRNSAELTMAVQSTAMCAQNLLLLAHTHGLGACWVCAPLFVPALVRDTLNLPSDWQPQGLITLGYPAQTKTKERADWHNKVIFR